MQDKIKAEFHYQSLEDSMHFSSIAIDLMGLSALQTICYTTDHWSITSKQGTEPGVVPSRVKKE